MRGTRGVPYIKTFYIFHGFQVVRSRNQAIQALTEKPLHMENTVFLQKQRVQVTLRDSLFSKLTLNLKCDNIIVIN